ncbi:SDR family oxidoreductase [Pseudoalteromonas luteoviolacea]|uniref:SDR family NAD(P)-dependent oxidoreductase n=1 Tax=Pseudoalteromonas luteoviolacea TaxID=43657 RepID=UPI001F254ABA|nr:SDR family oxidoreductase [Pseudoalteromonas luteoviolacea]MCF6442964.1 SDR family oxidoreductase [Pseudoalteromonas luteoviolacea]
MKRNILVVGASRGIGLAVAQFYHAQGNNVISVSRTPSSVGQWIEADISHIAGIQKVLDATSHLSIDALLYMGGIWEENAFTKDYNFEASPYSETKNIINVNQVAPIELVKGLLPSFRQSENPRAIFIGATSGLDISTTSEVAYSASKFGLRGAVHSLRIGYKNEGIGFTTINPGLVGTEEVLADIHSGEFAGLIPIPIEDVVRTVDFVMQSNIHTDIGDITLTQKYTG